jgi:uncharacterized membrane protein
MVVLPPQAPDRQLLPYLPPHTFYALCRYDLSAGPVLVTATVSGAGWALSLHSPQGDNFYVLPGQPQRRAEVSFLVMGSGQDAAAKRDSPTDTRIVSPTTAGLIVVRAPLRGLAWAAQTEEILRQVTCTQVKP